MPFQLRRRRRSLRYSVVKRISDRKVSALLLCLADDSVVARQEEYNELAKTSPSKTELQQAKRRLAHAQKQSETEALRLARRDYFADGMQVTSSEVSSQRRFF